MSTNLEIEFKSVLSKEDYDKLIAHFDKGKIYSQNNYYIDDKDLNVVKKKCGLRIREKDKEFELTIKIPEHEGKMEINQQISAISFSKFQNEHIFPEGEVKDYLANELGIKIENLYILGNLITNRLDIKYKTALISIDESLYNNIADYELECEDKNMELARKHLSQFLAKYDIKYKKSHGGKLKRFLLSLKN